MRLRPSVGVAYLRAPLFTDKFVPSPLPLAVTRGYRPGYASPPPRRSRLQPMGGFARAGRRPRDPGAAASGPARRSRAERPGRRLPPFLRVRPCPPSPGATPVRLAAAVAGTGCAARSPLGRGRAARSRYRSGCAASSPPASAERPVSAAAARVRRPAPPLAPGPAPRGPVFPEAPRAAGRRRCRGPGARLAARGIRGAPSSGVRASGEGPGQACSRRGWGVSRARRRVGSPRQALAEPPARLPADGAPAEFLVAPLQPRRMKRVGVCP